MMYAPSVVDPSTHLALPAAPASTLFPCRRYWSFMQKRRWGGYKKGAAGAAGASSHASADPSGASFHQQPEHKSAVRTQLAGLRHRAAIRANRKGPRWTAAAAAAEAGAEGSSDQQQQQPEQQPEAMASLEYDSSEMSDGCNMASGGSAVGHGGQHMGLASGSSSSAICS